MLTTGFKLWFGFLIAAFAAAVFIGYTTGGTETGPLTLGWKGRSVTTLPTVFS